MAEEKVKSLLEGGAVALRLDSNEVAAAKKELPAPKGITHEEAEELRARACALAQQLEEASGSKEMEIIDSVTTLGLQTQRQAASELGLLKGRIKDTLNRQDPTGQVTNDLLELRLALKQIAPPELSHPSLFDRLLDIVPFSRRLLRLLEKIAMRYELVSRQVVVIETRLRQGRIMLTRDNVELRKLYEQVESQQPAVRKNAYLGDLLMQEIQALMERTAEPRKREKIQSALHDVAMRVQDLRAIEEVHSQFFVSIEMTRQNNTRLGQAVERTLTLATNVVTVGLAIQVALARQRRVLEATQRTRQFLGDMIVANAETIKRHTQEIGDVYSEPVIAVEKITQAHNALLEAIDMANQLKQDGIASARENISKLSHLAGVLEERFTGAREFPEGKSLEA
ncbi:MAG TPA: toxic anion resistance protein [Blastocatellia bacterium]|nr:toxic anion resistance protein [Blastocatellia bacterium]